MGCECEAKSTPLYSDAQRNTWLEVCPQLAFDLVSSQELHAFYLLSLISFKIILHIVDINECITGTHNCGIGQTCVNTLGSFRCQRDTSCGTGYELTDDSRCKGMSCAEKLESSRLKFKTKHIIMSCSFAFGKYTCNWDTCTSRTAVLPPVTLQITSSGSWGLLQRLPGEITVFYTGSFCCVLEAGLVTKTGDYEGSALTLYTVSWRLFLASSSLFWGIDCSLVSGVPKSYSWSISNSLDAPE